MGFVGGISATSPFLQPEPLRVLLKQFFIMEN